MGSFNWEELEGADEPVEVSASFQDDVVESLTGTSEVDDQMSEVEARLEVASYYRLLLNDRIFEGDVSSAAMTVEKEIREFVRERLGVLLNVNGPALRTQSAFTDEEVTALKMVASRVQGKPALVVQKATPKTPTLRKVEQENRRERPRGPVLKKQGQVAAKPAAVAAPPPKPKTKRNKSGAVFEKLEDGTVLGKVGSKVFKHHGVDGEGKDVWLDVTPQARSKKAVPIPMPVGRDLEAITQMQASKTASNAEVIEQGEKIPGLIHTAIAAAVQS